MPDAVQVLHVDDERDFAEVAATFLEREDDRFEVEIATSASRGIDRLASTGEDVDCIVSDYDMPGQNGIEFVELVREERSNLPFIRYTGKGSDEVLREAISAGVTDYIHKDPGQNSTRCWPTVSIMRSNSSGHSNGWNTSGVFSRR